VLQHAFKEWAVICRALAEGRQALILRKGGIAERDHTFRPDHQRFWLYPTYLHQQAHGIQRAGADLLAAVERDRPPAGTVPLAAYAETGGVYHVDNFDKLLLLSPLHLWTEATVRQRFDYRHPGLYVLPVRVQVLPQPHVIHETPAYAGCKSWVELERPLADDDARPVLDDDAFRKLLGRLDDLLSPTAFA
jgi:hypothetical protein